MLVERVLPTALKRLRTIPADAALTETAALLSNTHISLVVVCNLDGVTVGIVTNTDVVRQIAQCAGSSCQDRLSKPSAD